MSKPNDLYWADQSRQMLKTKYKEFLENSGLENTFDNCNDFLSRSYGTNISKSEFGVYTRVALARIISGQEPNDFSL